MLDFDALLFRIDMTARMARPGSLLVAEPFLRDSYFNHSVVVLVDYAIGGKAMGIVLNHPTGYTLQQLLSAVKAPEPVRVYCGGPMSCDRLYFVHTLGDLIPDARPIGDGLWIGGDFDSMLAYVNSGYPVEGVLRFFLGYSGWDTGQLDEELGQHVWAVADPISPETLLTHHEDSCWHAVVRSMGPEFRGWDFYPKNILSN